LLTAGAALAATAIAPMVQRLGLHRNGTETLRVGLVGCGGRVRAPRRKRCTPTPTSSSSLARRRVQRSPRDGADVAEGEADIAARVKSTRTTNFVGFDPTRR